MSFYTTSQSLLLVAFPEANARVVNLNKAAGVGSAALDATWVALIRSPLVGARPQTRFYETPIWLFLFYKRAGDRKNNF